MTFDESEVQNPDAEMLCSIFVCMFLKLCLAVRQWVFYSHTAREEEM